MATAGQKRSSHVIPADLLSEVQRKAPVDVVGLASGLGLAVWEMPLSSDISGKILFDPEHGGNSGYSVIINKTDPFVRKRFTLAHEIAHFVLHRERIGNGLQDDAMYRSGLSTIAEVQETA